MTLKAKGTGYLVTMSKKVTAETAVEAVAKFGEDMKQGITGDVQLTVKVQG